MTWNKRLTEARKAKGIIKSAFAKMVGVSAPTVTQWESGEITKMDAMNLIKVCEVLQISPTWLMTGQESKAAQASAQKDRRIAHVVEILQSMESYQVDQAVKIVDTIAQPKPANGTGG